MNKKKNKSIQFTDKLRYKSGFEKDAHYTVDIISANKETFIIFRGSSTC